MATTLNFDNGYRLQWKGIAIDVQQRVTPKKGKNAGQSYWKDIGHYSHVQLAQATKHIVRHYASTHGEVAPEELTRRLEAFVAGIEEVLARIEEAA